MHQEFESAIHNSERLRVGKGFPNQFVETLQEGRNSEEERPKTKEGV